MLQDFRFALRLLRRHAATASVAVLTLAIGIGATSTVFGLLDALFLKTLPVAAPESLVRLQLVTPDGGTQTSFSYPLFSDFRDHAPAFAGLAGYVEGPATLRLSRLTDRPPIENVTSGYFDVLGAVVSQGRMFTRDEERAAAPVAVLSDDLWRRAFPDGRSPLGETVFLDGRPFSVIGVAPQGFTGVRRAAAPALWVPAPWFLSFIGMPLAAQERGVAFLGIVARLGQGVTAGAAADQATAVAQRVEKDLNDGRIAALAAPRGDNERLTDLQGTARLIAGAVILLLVIACANVMHILLAWGEGRRREIAMRLALGASRSRVLRQSLVESTVLAALATVLGVLLAAWGLALASRAPVFGAAGLFVDARLDWRTLAASAAAGALTALLAGALPAWRAARQSVMYSMRRAAGGHAQWRSGGVLAVTQIALSLLLLSATGLLTRSLTELRGVDLHMRTSGVLALQARFGPDVSGDRLGAGADRVLASLEALPKVTAAAAATTLPVSASGMSQRFDAGTTAPAVDTASNVELQFVSPSFFETVGLPFVEGRPFSAADAAANPIVVNESFARRFWPLSSAVGRTFTQKSDAGDEVFQVVGVARDTKYRSLRESGLLAMYRPLGGFPTRGLALLVRADGDAAALGQSIRRRLQEVEPGLTIWSERTLDAHIDRTLELERGRRAALAIFATLALVLVLLGVYGVIAYSVSRRLREFGIRAALGAKPQALLALVLVQAGMFVGLGVLAGSLGVHAVGRVMASELYGVTPGDTATLAGSAALLAAVAALAAYLPARRAARVDPVAVLPAD